VIVVGGGIAGLTAALACADGGARVTVLEARGRLGGATWTAQRQGLWVDNGQHVFLRACTAYRRFLARVGADGLVDLQRRMAVPVIAPGGRTAWLRRAWLPAPLQLGPSVARYHHLGLLDRLRVAAGALRLARLDPSREDLDGQTLAEWLVSHGQTPSAVERFWNLIALPTLNVDATEASLDLAATMFRTGFFTEASAADIGYARVPLDRLHAEPAGRALVDAGAEVHLRHRVHCVGVAGPGGRPDESAGQGGRPEGTDGAAVRGVTIEGDHIDAEAVILAVPHEETGALLPTAAGVDVGGLGRLGSSPIVNVHVVYDRRVTDLSFAAGVGTPVQFVFDRTAASGMAASDGRQYLAISLSGADEYISMPTDELRSLFTAELARVFPQAATARVERFFVTREAAATFRAVPGTAALRLGTRTGVERLYLSGAWTDTGWPATMEGAARSGQAAAEAALMDVGLMAVGRGRPQEAIPA
jgi:squalene-associated FAD-dependent desaturase